MNQKENQVGKMNTMYENSASKGTMGMQLTKNIGVSMVVSIYSIVCALLVLALMGSIVFAVQSPPAPLNLTAGSTTYAEINSSYFETLRWGGIKVIHNGIQLSEGTLPFLTSTVTSPAVLEAAFPGPNHNDGQHLYIATQDSVFDLTKLRNISASDLLAYGLFNNTQYPQFYDNWTDGIHGIYYGRSENPNATFCCNLTTILVGAVNITAFHITLNYEYDYYLGMYNYNGKNVPMYIAPHHQTSCYNSTLCYAQFLIPLSSSVNLNFFSINRLGTYTFDTYVDGVATTIIPQTAKPYNITLRAHNLYNGQIASNIAVAIGERDGQNIFVPYRLSGYVSKAYSEGRTDSNGYESFIGAPTVYPSTGNYSFFVASIIASELTSVTDLSVASADTLTFGPKHLLPLSLFDNAKTSINAMNQINSFLFRWVSVQEKAVNITVTYDIGTKVMTVDREPGSYNDFQLQTGIPHVITVIVTNNSVPTLQSTHYAQFHETDGYLVVNPYTDSSPLTHPLTHHLWQAPQQTPLIIVPTSLGAKTSNISLDIYDSFTTKVVASLNATVVQTLSLAQSGVDGVTYKNDLLKTVVNAINQVLHSLYVALNT